MIAKMVEVDLREMRKRGFAPTDDDVVRLNDLCIRIERGRQTTVANAPRSAIAGNVTLHEPTVAAIEWWHNYGRDSAMTTHGKLHAYYYMLAHATDASAFDGLESARDIRRAVRLWMRTVYATEGELWRALLYVRHGDEDGSEQPKGDALDRNALDDEAVERVYRMMIAAAGALGVAPAALRCETPTTLVSLLVEANVHARIPMKTSVARDYMAYQRIVHEIEARGRKGGTSNG